MGDKRVVMLAVLALAAVAVILAFNQPASISFQDEVPAAVIEEGPPVTPTRLNRALKIARDYWATTLRCAGISLRSHPLPKRHMIARAAWSNDQAGRYSNCSVTFNSRHKRLAFWLYCGAMIHELGHLSGFHEPGGLSGGAHSRHSSNIMHPSLTGANVPAMCKLKRDSGL